MTSRPPKPSRGRALLPDELRLWRKVTESVVPVNEEEIEDDMAFEAMMRQYDVPQTPRPLNETPPRLDEAIHRGNATHVQQPALGRFDARQSRQISRGHIEIEAVLDLHGMRQSEAQGALKRFLVQSQARGARFVTVITGKGRRADDDEAWWEGRERGVLRRVVRAWLEEAEFRSLVVSYTTAPRTHGGEGALFVHVRRANRPQKK